MNGTRGFRLLEFVCSFVLVKRCIFSYKQIVFLRFLSVFVLLLFEFLALHKNSNLLYCTLVQQEMCLCVCLCEHTRSRTFEIPPAPYCFYFLLRCFCLLLWPQLSLLFTSSVDTITEGSTSSRVAKVIVVVPNPW